MRFALVCGGCGASPDADDPLPFRCPHADRADDVDHVLARVATEPLAWPDDDDANPFVRFRALTFPWAFARAHGLADEAYVGLVRRLDEAVARVDGHGFAVTPLVESAPLAARLGVARMFVKDETGNVAGSHKGRHLFGIALQLEVAAALRGALVGAAATAAARAAEAPLAIASCGNAALAAAVVARALGRRLCVFIPTSADAVVVERLRALGATLTVCARQPGVAGDPTYHAFRSAVADGALPFTCQGGDNGLTLDGGRTLGYELAAQLPSEIDALFVQVGGGALASAVTAALAEAAALGRVARAPRLFTVQTRGAWPLARAWERLRAHGGALDDALRFAAAHRRSFMWPWEAEPHSVAHGILDDETYDWLAIARAMAQSGGEPVVVEEPTVVEANALAREATGLPVDATGSAGLAGALALARGGRLERQARVAAIFSGVSR